MKKTIDWLQKTKRKLEGMLIYIEGKSKRASVFSAGHDVYSVEDVTLPPGKTLRVKTGVRVRMPEGVVGLFCARSGLAVRGITILNAPGIIDADFTGECDAIMYNSTTEPYEIKEGDRIGQLVFVNYLTACNVQWDGSERGNNGYGSSGK